MPIADSPHRDPQPESGARDPRIEPLLLAGLDRYFAGEFEHAIQVWSRVFFVDRGNARARAYIERARGALAERQREAEARMGRSDAFRSGTHRLSTEDSHGTSSQRHEPDGPRDSGSFRRERHTAAATATAAARAIAPAPASEPRPAVVPHDVPTARDAARHRLIAHALLIALAAALLFTAGYVVAARDQLATWWNGTELASPAGDIPPADAPAPGRTRSSPAQAGPMDGGKTTAR